jgi:hypothetical protein
MFSSLAACKKNKLVELGEFASLPASLTHPVFSIYDISNNKLVDTLNALELDPDDKGFFRLPREGTFAFRATGYQSSNGLPIQWDFCGEVGVLGSQMIVEMKKGVCKSTPQQDYLRQACAEPLIPLFEGVEDLLSGSSQPIARNMALFWVVSSISLIGVLILFGVSSLRLQRGVASHGFATLNSTERGCTAEDLRASIEDPEVELEPSPKFSLPSVALQL